MPLCLFSFPLLFSVAQNVDAMAEPGVAILDHKEILEMEAVCGEKGSNELEFLKTVSLAQHTDPELPCSLLGTHS